MEIYNVIFFILSITSNYGNLLTLKTIVLGDVSPILNSINRSVVSCIVTMLVDAIDALSGTFNERTSRRDFNS